MDTSVMNGYWSLYDARNQLSRLVAQAKNAPQTITVRGKEAVVVISAEEYRRKFRFKKHFVDISLETGGILDDDDAILERNKTTPARGTDFKFTLATRNVGDFDNTEGLSVINPWK